MLSKKLDVESCVCYYHSLKFKLVILINFNRKIRGGMDHSMIVKLMSLCRE